MRLLLVLSVLLAGCELGHADAQWGGDDTAPGPRECVTAADCVLAASSCCGCPEFAMPDRGWQDGCEALDCEPADVEGACAQVIAVCDRGACSVACAPIACELSCEAGFAVDAAGCQVCACDAGSPTSACAVDTDCVAVPADCCGCARGGADTAVLAAEATAHATQLGCPDQPGASACPEIDVCDPGLTARCVAGRCGLGDDRSPPEDPGVCGRPDLPPCSPGAVCLLNSDADASMQGLGTCQEQ